MAGLQGVDPSFLEALPESIRREVIADQLRLARIQNQVQVSTTAAETTTTNSAAAASSSSAVLDVNPEFMAALPPAIQEEVRALSIMSSL